MKLYKRLSVLLTMGIMGIGLITFSTAPGKVAGYAEESGSVAGKGETKTNNTNVKDKTTPTPEPTATPTPEPNYLMKNSNNKINELVKAYLAAKLTCSQDSFEGIVTDTSFIDVDTLMIQTETVTSYELLDCYIKRGISPVDFVVYYTYNMSIATIGSPILAFDSLYVKIDENGNYLVYLGRLDDEVEKSLDDLNNDADVQAVLSEVADEISKAMDEDETVLQYWQRLYEKLGITNTDSQQEDGSGQTENVTEE